jgi:hypothetical protein
VSAPRSDQPHRQLDASQLESALRARASKLGDAAKLDLAVPGLSDYAVFQAAVRAEVVR